MKERMKKTNNNNYLDSNNFSIGIHSFKVLVQIHYSHSPPPLWWVFSIKSGDFFT